MSVETLDKCIITQFLRVWNWLSEMYRIAAFIQIWTIYNYTTMLSPTISMLAIWGIRSETPRRYSPGPGPKTQCKKDAAAKRNQRTFEPPNIYDYDREGRTTETLSTFHGFAFRANPRTHSKLPFPLLLVLLELASLSRLSCTAFPCPPLPM